MSSVYFDRELADTIERRAIERRQCAAPGCSVRAVAHRAGEWWFCQEHATMWRTHNKIVQRILSIPPRD
jgi:hypothetical protein